MIAGYEKELEESFSVNPGLERRFPCRFTIDSYSGEELHEMLKRRAREKGAWLDDEAKSQQFMVSKKDGFPHFGGDIETFLKECKKAHALRIFGLSQGKRVLTMADLGKAISALLGISRRRGRSHRRIVHIVCRGQGRCENSRRVLNILVSEPKS